VPHHPEPFATIAEFDDAAALVAAASEVRRAGYTRLDAYSPFPVEGLAGALGFREPLLPWIALAGGLAGGIGGYLMQWTTNGLDYPINVGGRPLDAWPAFAVISFYLMSLGTILATIGGMLALNRLPRLHHPIFDVPHFEQVTVDRFFLAIERDDPRFDEERTPALLERLGARSIAEVPA
jgi:Alternative complex III, ActD subunit